MTIKAKNTTIVFAFAALLLIMPMAGSNAFADNVAIVDAACGFDESNPPSFGTFNRGDATVTEVTATFTPKAGASGTGTIFVSALDWVGEGSRSDATITIVADFDAGDLFTVNSLTYTAAAGDQSASNTQFSFDGGQTAAEIANEIAQDINSQDTTMRASTNGDNTIEVEVEARGAAGDGTGVSFTDQGAASTSSVSGNTANGGTGATESKLPAENTKFSIVADATTTPGGSTGDLYSAKTAMPEDGAALEKEMISGTTDSEAVEISFEIDVSFIAAASQTIALASVGAGDTVTVRGITYTAVSGTAGDREFDISGGTDILDADELVIAINNADGTVLTAANGGTDTVTVTADIAGIAGNSITLQETGTTITIGGATMAGGTENLENFPYDGTISQDLTFTIDCTGV